MYSNVNKLLKSPRTRSSIKILNKSNCTISFVNTQLHWVIDNHFFCRMARKKKRMDAYTTISACLTFRLITGQPISSLHTLQSTEYPEGHSQTSSSGCHADLPSKSQWGRTTHQHTNTFYYTNSSQVRYGSRYFTEESNKFKALHH